MTRVEDNERVCIEMIKRVERNKSFGSYEEESTSEFYERHMSFNSAVIATMLVDISKSLAIIADKIGSEE